MTPKPVRIAIYTRVSSTEQSVEMQLTDLRAYAERRGFSVHDEYTDHAVSGTKATRPSLSRLMADARQAKFDAVLVWRFDRFARSTSHLLQALEEFRTLGLTFISFNEAIDTSTPAGQMLFTMVAAVAQFEREIIKERVNAGVSAARSRGVRFGRPPRLDHDRIRRLRASGKTLSQIATEVGTEKSVVSKVLRNRAS